MLNNDVNPKTLSRIELLKLAQTLRVTDADVMTRAELRAAIERARAPESRPQLQPVSWLGKARRLIASVVERGLHFDLAQRRKHQIAHVGRKAHHVGRMVKIGGGRFERGHACSSRVDEQPIVAEDVRTRVCESGVRPVRV